MPVRTLLLLKMRKPAPIEKHAGNVYPVGVIANVGL